MTARKLVVVALGVLLACQLSATDPQPASPDAPYRADLPIHRVLRQISFPGQGFARPGSRPRPGGNRPGNSRPTQGGQAAAPVGQCSNCVPIVACAALLEQVSTTCQLPDAGLGVCCPSLPSASVGKGDSRLFKEPRIQVDMRSLSTQDVNSACQQGLSFLNQVDSLESRMISSNQQVKKFTPEYGHLKFFKVTRTARQAHQAALQVNQASRAMMSEFNLTPAQGSHGLRQVPVRQSILAENCPVAPRCNPNAKYRTIDGSCNNLDNPLYGKSETAFQRIMPPVYDDGVSSPRNRSVTGTPLPLERTVASNILVDRNDEDREFTLSVMQWAQFIDHDFTQTPFASLPNGEGIECCPNGQEATGANRHPECWPINLPRDDPFYAPKGRFCMNFVRSMLGLNAECTFGYAEQMNQLTHWLDGSNIYGSTATEAARLRENQNGRLRVSQGNLLPIDSNNSGECMAQQRGGVCFHAGDSRVNEQPGLTAIHIIFHREHNRVADILRSMHPRWSDEALFQEARRIVVAEYQHILFNEWLPIIVGQNFMQSFGLNPLPTGFSFDYNFNINPSINNEFATGAFRFGHSLVQGFINLYDANNQVSQIQLRNHFNSPHIFRTTQGAVDMFARTFTRQAIQKFDSFVTDDLSNHLFQTPATQFGMDLMSLNLHRGRDHGMAPYNAIREVCGLPRARSMADFNDQVPSDIIQRMQQLYDDPNDVDFFVGGMSEKPVSGGLLGWTFLCVVGDQFARLKKGDRFFYDVGGQPGSFTPGQLTEIRRASWARILCDNTNIGTVQPLAFRLPNQRFNPVTRCSSVSAIPRLNIEGHWRNEVPQA